MRFSYTQQAPVTSQARYDADFVQYTCRHCMRAYVCVGMCACPLCGKACSDWVFYSVRQDMNASRACSRVRAQYMFVDVRNDV